MSIVVTFAPLKDAKEGRCCSLAGRKAWLAIGIPSAPRRDGATDYLSPTVESLVAELPIDPTDPLYGRVRDNRTFRHDSQLAMQDCECCSTEGSGLTLESLVVELPAHLLCGCV